MARRRGVDRLRPLTRRGRAGIVGTGANTERARRATISTMKAPRRGGRGAVAVAMALAISACTAEDAAAPPGRERRHRAGRLSVRARGWHTVAVGGVASVDVPGDVVDTTPARDCGNGPAVRILEGHRPQVPTGAGHDLHHPPLSPGDKRNGPGGGGRSGERAKTGGLQSNVATSVLAATPPLAAYRGWRYWCRTGSGGLSHRTSETPVRRAGSAESGGLCPTRSRPLSTRSHSPR